MLEVILNYQNHYKDKVLLMLKIMIIIGGVQPHFCLWKNVCFPIFSHGEKWGKKYMEREGNEYFSLSFHILFFPFFPMGKNGKVNIFPWAKMGFDPPPNYCFIWSYIRYLNPQLKDPNRIKLTDKKLFDEIYQKLTNFKFPLEINKNNI